MIGSLTIARTKNCATQLIMVRAGVSPELGFFRTPRIKGPGLGSFDTRLCDVGEVGTPACLVALMLALWILNDTKC